MSQPELTFDKFERGLKAQVPDAQATQRQDGSVKRPLRADDSAPAALAKTPMTMPSDDAERRAPVRVLALAMNQSILQCGLRTCIAMATGLTWFHELQSTQLAGQAETRPGPDVVLMDGDTAGPTCFAEWEALERRLPELRLVLLQGLPVERSAYGNRLLRRAACVLDKSASFPALVQAIRAVHRGDAVAPENRNQIEVSPSAISAPGRELTRREREVLELLAQGLPNRQIALRLGLKSATVKFHVTRIMVKLQAANRTEAMLLSMRQGLVDRT